MTHFDEDFENFADGIEDDEDLQDDGNYEYFEAPGDFVIEILEVSHGVHDQDPTKNRYGDPFVAASAYVHKTRGDSTLYEKQKRSMYFALPDKPKYANWREKRETRDYKGMLAACQRVGIQFVGGKWLPVSWEDDGALVRGLLVGMRVRADEKKDGRVFHNPTFYPVDANGDPIETGEDADEMMDIHGFEHALGNRIQPAGLTIPKRIEQIKNGEAGPSMTSSKTAESGDIPQKVQDLRAAGMDPGEYGFPEYAD